MAEFSLFDADWRQGSVFKAELPIPSVKVMEGGPPRLVEETHGLWAVATQDCDLSTFPVTEHESIVELRPVFDCDPPSDWGIRARKLLLSKDLYCLSESPRLHISPAALMQFRDKTESPLTDGRTRAFKTWLGLRYDRPAVPPEYVDLMRAIAQAVEKPKTETQNQVHDVLVEINEDDPPLYRVFVVIVDGADHTVIRAWVADRLCRVDGELGALEALEVGTKAEVSLEVIENSYAASLSQVTWGKASGPVGAT
ncbi:hypothetical protein [Streptomyces sp. NPDC059538]|uniref:hypothetical protein n=1 Tax=Streptomyces sp. NPDC059538 TaxID=3346860 RepID=UPI0036D07C2B